MDVTTTRRVNMIKEITSWLRDLDDHIAGPLI